MPSIGPLEAVILLVIALVVLGPKRLPQAGRSVGRGIREFRDGLASTRSELKAGLGQEGDEAPSETPS